MNVTSANFLMESQTKWEDLGGGVFRQVVGYDDALMLVIVRFTKGAVGAVHHHFHSQSSFVASGSFEVSIKGEKKILKSGDGFYVEPNVAHGVVCLEEGILIDAFSPARQDFL